jgi:hypothetical protein
MQLFFHTRSHTFPSRRPRQAHREKEPNGSAQTYSLLQQTPQSIMSTTLSIVQAASMMPNSHGTGTQLAKRDNDPDKRDVLLGRGKKHAGHPGNMLFVGTNLDFARSMLILDRV